MRYLFVMAHPDDEADIGGTIYRLSITGNETAIAFVVGKVSARRNISMNLQNEINSSILLLGVNKVFFADFPNIKLNTVARDEIVSFISQSIMDWDSDVVVTHHCSDLNIDHAITGLATIDAVRIVNNSSNRKKISGLFIFNIYVCCKLYFDNIFNSICKNKN